MREQVTLYEAVGGEETFRRLVARFYQGVAGDPVLRAVYPEEDLSAAEERLRLFLIEAIRSLGLPDELAAPLLEYVTMASAALTNRAG